MSINFNRIIYNIVDFSKTTLDQAGTGELASAEQKLNALRDYVGSMGLSSENEGALLRRIANMGITLAKLQNNQKLILENGKNPYKEQLNAAHEIYNVGIENNRRIYRTTPFEGGDSVYNIELKVKPNETRETFSEPKWYEMPLMEYRRKDATIERESNRARIDRSDQVCDLRGALNKFKEVCELSHCGIWIQNCNGDIEVNGEKVQGSDDIAERVKRVNAVLQRQFEAKAPLTLVVSPLEKGTLYNPSGALYICGEQQECDPQTASELTFKPISDYVITYETAVPRSDFEFKLFSVKVDEETGAREIKVIPKEEYTYEIKRKGEAPKVALLQKGGKEEVSAVRMQPQPKPTSQTLTVSAKKDGEWLTQPGETLVLCGSGALTWNPAEGKPLVCVGEQWKIDLDAKEKCEFKIVKKASDGSFIWENREANRTFDPAQKQETIADVRF